MFNLTGSSIFAIRRVRFQIFALHKYFPKFGRRQTIKILNIDIHTLAKRSKIADPLIGKDYDVEFYIQQAQFKAKELVPRALLH